MALPIHVGAVQYATDIRDRTTNTDKALHLIDDAAHICDLVVLPEISFTGYQLGKEIENVAEPIPGAMTSLVSQIAVNRNTHVCFGIIERDGDKYYNTAVLIGADGSIIGKHRKILLTGIDQKNGFSDGQDLEVFDTRVGKIGILVGSDIFDAENIRTLDNKGAQLVLIPSVALAIPPRTIESQLEFWQIALTANARYGRCYVIWANKIGFDGELAAVGNSMILDLDGHIIVRGSMEEEVVRSEISLGRKPLIRGQRPELFAPAGERV